MSDIGHPSSDPVVNENNVTYTTEMAPRSLNIAPRSHRLTYPTSLMKTTASSPNLLNEICEENESDFEESPRNSPNGFRRQPRRQRKYDKKRHGCRLSPIHSRRSSCSSSDDEELQKLDRRLNIQAAISAARILPNVPENSGDKESSGEKNGCDETGKGKSLDLLERFFEAENNANLLNLLDAPSKLFVNSVTGRVRNLSDTNLVSYQARYRLPILKDMKCSRSDTNLAITVNGKKALIQRPDVMKLSLKQHPFGLCNSPTLSSASPIEEENPSDISPDASPVAEPKHGFSHGISNRDTSSPCDNSDAEENIAEANLNSSVLPIQVSSEELESSADVQPKEDTTTANGKQVQVSSPAAARKKSSNQKVSRPIDADEFSSIQESEEGTSTLQVGSNSVRDCVQSRSGSRSSLKYHYNEAVSVDGNSCYTIAETRPPENDNLRKDQAGKDARTLHGDIPSYSVSKFGRMVVSNPVNSKCCTII